MPASKPAGSSFLSFSNSTRTALITSSVLAVGMTHTPMKTACSPEKRTAES